MDWLVELLIDLLSEIIMDLLIVIVDVSIIFINLIYIEVYVNVSSCEFKELKIRLVVVLIVVFEGYFNFFYVVVISFSNGSVIVNYFIVLSDVVFFDEV